MESESGMNHLKAFLEKEASRGRAARWYVIGLDDDEDRYSLAHFLHMSNDIYHGPADEDGEERKTGRAGAAQKHKDAQKTSC